MGKISKNQFMVLNSLCFWFFSCCGRIKVKPGTECDGVGVIYFGDAAFGRVNCDVADDFGCVGDSGYTGVGLGPGVISCGEDVFCISGRFSPACAALIFSAGKRDQIGNGKRDFFICVSYGYRRVFGSVFQAATAETIKFKEGIWCL